LRDYLTSIEKRKRISNPGTHQVLTSIQQPLKRLKIAYISNLDAHNKVSWSGVHYSVWQTLQRNIGDVDLLGPIEAPLPLLLCKVVHGLSLYLFGKRFNYRHSVFLSKAYKKILEKKLRGKKYDLIVAPAGSVLIAFLETKIPIFYFSDATNANLMNYRKMLTNLWGWSARQSLYIERLALDKAHYISFSSQWACDSAIRDFQVPAEKVKLIPFGANFETIPDRNLVLQPRQKNTCKLFFLGVDWEHKGGPVAFGTLLSLLSMGIDAELTVVGCAVPPSFTHPRFRSIPFLNKNNPEEAQQMINLYRESSFFLLPTLSECYGIVFCEAAAYGLPAVAGNSGGVSSSIAEGKSGFLLPKEAGAEAYAATLAAVWKDQARYEALRISARDLFEQARNWDSWALRVKEMLESKPASKQGN
jgi:glycosyltransferase involved in cell wall biosynthesis